MSAINHHVTDGIMRDYVSGALSYAFELVVATHVSMCDECRVRLGVHETLGGAALDGSPPEQVSDGLRDAVLARIDDTVPAIRRSAAFDVYPTPLAEVLGGQAPRWRSLGLGVRQCVLHQDRDSSVRLLFIPPKQAVPEHGHNGLELTLVLQGSFSDQADHFAVGDLEVADGDLTHVPVSGSDAPCICLAATTGRLKFTGMVPRLTQRLFRI
jgi:putative transcriptional regulator